MKRHRQSKQSSLLLGIAVLIGSLTLMVPTAQAEGLFNSPRTTDLGGGWAWNSMLGYIYREYEPFIYCYETQEWLWTTGGTETQGYYFWRFGAQEWAWTYDGFYPYYMTHTKLGSWLPDLVLNRFLVIDLSGGAEATNYPVTYLNTVPGGGWPDEYKTTKLVLRRIPAGTFTMGSPAGELGRNSDENEHTVTLTKDYYMGVFEVTQRQWELVMGNRPSYFYNSSYYTTRPVEQVSYYDIRENTASNSDDPVVDWPANSVVNANSFMGKLRDKTGLTRLDLPTEAQWEYACRAGTETALNSGVNLTNTEQDPEMAKVGRGRDWPYWYNGGSAFLSGGDPSNGTAKVGSYQPNAWGLYDLHGNVLEWCLDRYGGYSSSPVEDPAGASSGSRRVYRGGGWYYYAWFCRSAYRGNHNPGFRDYGLLGFRLALRSVP